MQVATNDCIILFAFVPIVKFLLGVSKVSVPYSTLFVSIFLFVVIPLARGILTRVIMMKKKGKDYLENVFVSHSYCLDCHTTHLADIPYFLYRLFVRQSHPFTI